MPRFLQAKVANSGSFNPSLPKAIMRMFNYVARPLDSPDIYALPGSNDTYTSKEIIAQICQSICCVLGDDVVLNFLFAGTPTPNSIIRPAEEPLRVLNETCDIHFEITAAIAVHSASRVHLLVRNLYADSLQHGIFGNHLITAIKLGDLKIVKELTECFQNLRIGEADQVTLADNTMENPLIYEAIETSISYNREDILLILVRLIRPTIPRFELRDLKAFESCVRMVAHTSNVRVLRYLFCIPVSSKWTLTTNIMHAICDSEDYDLIYFAFCKADCAYTHPISEEHPLHIAIRSGLEATRAVYDTGKYDINERLSWSYRIYSDEPVTALDVAIYQQNYAIIKWLLDHGSHYRRRFPSFYICGRIYNYVRDRAIVDDPRMVNLPSYGQYASMSWEAKESFIFGLG